MNPPFRTVYLSLFLLSTWMLGCASGRPAAPPPYTGQDQVDVVAPNAVLGTWITQVINPLKGTEANTTEVTYRDDGTFTALITPNADTTSPLGTTPLALAGRWSVDGGSLAHRDVEVAVSDEDPLAAVLASLLNTTRSDLGGTANFYEQSADHLVLVDAQGIATRYTRP